MSLAVFDHMRESMLGLGDLEALQSADLFALEVDEMRSYELPRADWAAVCGCWGACTDGGEGPGQSGH